MRKLPIGILALLFFLSASAQQELHIHHINIGNGDATMIGIFDKGEGKYTAKMLIDGGKMTASARLVPYVQSLCAHDDAPTNFNYTALTHYHDDHYTGLLAFKKGDLTCDTLIDPGGYELDEYFTSGSYPGSEDFPDVITNPRTWFRKLDVAVANGYIRAHSKLLVSFGTTSRSDIGKKFTLGKVGNDKVQIQCVAGWGNTLSANGIEPNPDPSRESPNNLCLAFLITCGEFRYFIGGDMGGQQTPAEAGYINQEIPLSGYFAKSFTSLGWTSNTTVKGHVCGYKSSHHGSEFSNSTLLLATMKPTITVTSAGDNDGWHLPSVPFLTRLSASTTISSGTIKKGVYFTNLYNFSGATWKSKTEAKGHFDNNPAISFDYGNPTAAKVYSYLIKVPENENLGEKSQYEVGRVSVTDDAAFVYEKLATFKCHRKG